MPQFGGRSVVLAAAALSVSALLLVALALPAGASARGVGPAARHRRDATPGPASCDVFSGSWALGDGPAAYTGYSCPLIDAEFNCQLYGRPDSDYLRYRWKPAGCELPRYVTPMSAADQATIHDPTAPTRTRGSRPI